MIEPSPLSSFEYEHREVVSRLLSEGWRASVSGAALLISVSDDLLQAEADHSNVRQHDPSTYGEITELGARQLFHYMNINADMEDDIVFVDLGSGAGKLVVQVFLEVPRLRRAVGIELAQSRHDVAIFAWDTVDTKAYDVRTALKEHASCCNEASVQFIQGDLFEVDVTDASHIYVASLCFTSEMMERLGDKLANEASRLKCVATLKPFPKRLDWRFGTPTVEYVEMSWTKSRGEGCAVYFYTPTLQ